MTNRPYGLWRDVLSFRFEILDSDSPEIVRKFVRATRAGWVSYLASPRSANEAIINANPEMDNDTLLKSAAVISELCRPAKFNVPLGSMTLERWQALRRQLIEIGLLSPTGSVSGEAFVDVGE